MAHHGTVKQVPFEHFFPHVRVQRHKGRLVGQGIGLAGNNLSGLVGFQNENARIGGADPIGPAQGGPPPNVVILGRRTQTFPAFISAARRTAQNIGQINESVGFITANTTALIHYSVIDVGGSIPAGIFIARLGILVVKAQGMADFVQRLLFKSPFLHPTTLLGVFLRQKHLRNIVGIVGFYDTASGSAALQLDNNFR